MHGSIPPVTIPPWQPPGQVRPLGPGDGELSEAVCVQGVGVGQIGNRSSETRLLLSSINSVGEEQNRIFQWKMGTEDVEP